MPNQSARMNEHSQTDAHELVRVFLESALIPAPKEEISIIAAGYTARRETADRLIEVDLGTLR